MKFTHPPFPTLLYGVLLTAAVHAGAATEGSTPSGVRYASGGVSEEEQQALRSRFGQYTLRVATAAKGSGAHLASVHALITDSAGKLVLEHRLDGPWLLAHLPPGRYRVELRNPAQGTAKEQVERRDVRIGTRGMTDLTVHFDAAAATTPEPAAPPPARP
jgi:hypothetical protein